MSWPPLTEGRGRPAGLPPTRNANRRLSAAASPLSARRPATQDGLSPPLPSRGDGQGGTRLLDCSPALPSEPLPEGASGLGAMRHGPPAPDSPQPAAPQGRAAGSLAEREKPCCSRHDPHWPCAPSTWTEYLDRDTVCGGPARASGAQRAMPRSLPATTRSCLRGPPCSWPLMRPVWPLECNQTASPAGCAVTSAPSSAPNLAPEDAGESSVPSTRHPERGAHARGSSAVNRRLSAVSVCHPSSLSPFSTPAAHRAGGSRRRPPLGLRG